MPLRVTLKALTPLSFRAGRHTEQSDTLPYVPGSSLLGALSEAHQRLRNDPDDFAALLLQHRLHVGNCYPATFKRTETVLREESHPVLPMPLTARSCKRFSGFKFQSKSRRDIKAGVTDALIPLALFALSNESRPDVLRPLDQHPETLQPLDRISGFFRRGLEAEHIGQPERQWGLRTRTGIHYETGTARSAVLYSREMLPEDSEFWGCWWIEEDLWETFDELAATIGDDGLRVGNNRTRGFGKVQFQASPLPQESSDEMQHRVEAFTERFKGAASEAGIEAPAGLYVPILCTSPVILSDAFLRARLRLHCDDLSPVGIEGAILRFHAASTSHIQGWSTLWGLPKADDWAIGMGSVFLFALPDSSPAIYEGLCKLQEQGLGARRSEGFGRLSVANQFHLDLAGGKFR